MNKPIIGITTRDDFKNGKAIYKINKNIIDKVVNNGGIPILIPPIGNIEEEVYSKLLKILNICSGFIIPGGNTWNLNDEIIIKYALNKDIPLLGICAGMQAIANLNNFCGTIDSDQTVIITSSINHNIDDKKYVHDIFIKKGLLFDILHKSKIKVNSRHQSTIKIENFFNIDAISNDNIVEAIHIPKKKFILSLQWHPEDLDDENSQKIFRSFIESAKNL